MIRKGMAITERSAAQQQAPHIIAQTFQRDPVAPWEGKAEVFITSHPRSGNAWLHRMVADALSAPIQTWRDGAVLTSFSRSTAGPYVVRKAHTPGWHADQPIIKGRGFVIFLRRDPRDVCISQMFFRQCVPTDENLMRTIRSNLATNSKQLPQDIRGTPIYEAWVRSYLDYPDRCDLMVRYEDLHTNGPPELARIIEAVTGKVPNMAEIGQVYGRQSFRNVKEWGPTLHTTGSMRRGKAGDWRNYFKREHGKVLAEVLNDLMLQDGYISSPYWWEELPE